MHTEGVCHAVVFWVDYTGLSPLLEPSEASTVPAAVTTTDSNVTVAPVVATCTTSAAGDPEEMETKFRENTNSAFILSTNDRYHNQKVSC